MFWEAYLFLCSDEKVERYLLIWGCYKELSLRAKPNHFQSTVPGGLILHDFFLRDFALTRLENIHQFNMIWHEQSVATLIFCRRPSIKRVDWLCWSYNHADTLVSSSTALVFLTNMSEKQIYITYCNPSKKSGTSNQYWREIRHIKQTWKGWTNCWQMP